MITSVGTLLRFPEVARQRYFYKHVQLEPVPPLKHVWCWDIQYSTCLVSSAQPGHTCSTRYKTHFLPVQPFPFSRWPWMHFLSPVPSLIISSPLYNSSTKVKSTSIIRCATTAAAHLQPTLSFFFLPLFVFWSLLLFLYLTIAGRWLDRRELVSALLQGGLTIIVSALRN